MPHDNLYSSMHVIIWHSFLYLFIANTRRLVWIYNYDSSASSVTGDEHITMCPHWHSTYCKFHPNVFWQLTSGRSSLPQIFAVQGSKCASQCKRSITCQNMSPAPSGLSKIIICASSSSSSILSLLKITHVSSHKTGLAILIVSFNFLVPGQFESTSGEYERGEETVQSS